MLHFVVAVSPKSFPLFFSASKRQSSSDRITNNGIFNWNTIAIYRAWNIKQIANALISPYNKRNCLSFKWSNCGSHNIHPYILRAVTVWHYLLGSSFFSVVRFEQQSNTLWSILFEANLVLWAHSYHTDFFYAVLRLYFVFVLKVWFVHQWHQFCI